MNEIWEVLGIAPTSEKKTIRAAYSAQSKQCHPEENPEEFKKLHEAYQAALKFAAEHTAGAEEKFDNALEFESRKEEKKKMLPAEPEEGEEEHPADSPSLLSLLEQQEEKAFEKSLADGALKQFSAILNDPKKFRKADAWKAFFMSEEFLKEQYSENFANGMLRLLQDFQTPDNYNIAQMPSGFILELVIAYALVLNPQQDGIRERTESFYAREVAASIWNMQQIEFASPTHFLSKPENQVRMRSFADYIRLKNFNRRGLLTSQNKDAWKEMIDCGRANYLYELKGRGINDIYLGSRSVCLLSLYVFWLQTEKVPKCVLEYMYQIYDLRAVEHTSTRKLYEPLKQEIIKQYPDIEEELYGEEGRAKLVSAWYRELMQIISDSETLYEETEEIKERVRALFASKEWEKVRFLPELFEKMYLQLHDRAVMPASIAKQLYEFYWQEKGSAAWDAEQCEAMIEGMLHSLYYGRMVLDIHGKVPARTPCFKAGKLWEVVGDVDAAMGAAGSARSDKHGMENADLAGESGVICTDLEKGYPNILIEQDFWHYFLMRGFGCWCVLMGGRNRCRRGYTTGMQYSLSSYIEYLYQPSGRWQKFFVGSCGKEKAPVPEFCRYFADENGNVVPGAEFVLPDGRGLRVWFYLHYVRYFLDGEEVFLPVYSFAEFAELAKAIKSPEPFFFLLAITKISKKDYEQAKERITLWLSRLPLAPVSIPVIAALLTKRSKKLWTDLEEAKICGISYIEENGLCFRAVIKENGFAVYRLTPLQWEHIHSVCFREENGALFAEDKKRMARGFLQELKRSAPILRSRISLDGLQEEEKAEQILEALRQNAVNRERENLPLPYKPGYPWTKKEIGAVLRRFYRQYGGFLSESYCVLHFGEEDTQDKKDHVFYCSMIPFGFSLASRSPDWPSRYEFCEKELHRKVKEKHWIVGHFGWGGLYGPIGEGVPKIIAVGESGTFYYYDVLRLLRAESLPALLAKMFDFSNITAVETYEGYLSISRFSGELEYCYGQEAFLHSAYSVEKTGADLFTIFTKSEMMEEFAVFMDELLKEAGDMQKLRGVYFEFRREAKGVCSMYVFSWEKEETKNLGRHSGEDISAREDEWEEDAEEDMWKKDAEKKDMEEDEWEEDTEEEWEEDTEEEWEEDIEEEWEEDTEEEWEETARNWGEIGNFSVMQKTPVYESRMQEKAPLIWKIWQQDGDFAMIQKDFMDIFSWYMDCGRYGRKLAECKKITMGFCAAQETEPIVSTLYEKGEEI